RYRHHPLRNHLQVDRKKLEDELFGGLIIEKKKANIVTVGLSGDWRDGVGGGCINAFTLNWVQGHLRGDTAEGGSFGKLQFSLLRLQHLNRTFRSEERRVGEEGRPREGDAGGQSGR